MPDTALHINKRPFFIPDYATPCIMHLHRAVHICRLGKSVSERFASRYYDAFTLCSRMEAPAMPPSIGCAFDECISVGEWLPVNPVDGITNCEDTENLVQLAAKAIAEVSKYFMLRQGDVILLDEVRAPEEVHINQHIEESFCGQPVLQFNIK